MTEEQQERLAVQNVIDTDGCQIIQIDGDNYMPPYAYTIGLYQQFNHPEVICFGLSQEVMYTLLMNVKDRLEDEQILDASKSYKGFLEKDVEVFFLEVNTSYYKDYLGYANWFYNGEEYPVLQLVWPDKKLNFPWEKKFDKELQYYQPLLDRNIDFKFYESRQLDVFTTQQVLDGAMVKYVVHDEEGDWFFLEDEDSDSEDLLIVKFEKIIKLDATLNTIFHLQYGYEALRETKNGEWDEREIIE